MKKMMIILGLFVFIKLNAQVNLNEGLIAWYQFSENANDQSGNEHHGVLLGGATTLGVLRCDDNDMDGLSLPHTVLDESTDFTIGFDIKFDLFHGDINTPGKTNIIFSGWRKMGVNPIDNELNIEYLKHGISGNQVIENSVRIFMDNQRYTFPFVDLSEQVWYNIILTRSSNLLQLYVNGVKIGDDLFVSDAPISIAENGLIIGQEQDVLGGDFVADQSMAGEMDNLCIYNRSLTLDEINEIYLNSHNTIVSTKSINNFDLSKMIQIFPNPFGEDTDILSIRNESDFSVEIIKVYDLTGKLLSERVMESNEALIQFRPFKNSNEIFSGVYLVQLIFEDGNQVSYKLLQK